MFDFYADPGAEHDEDNFIAKVQRRDIVLLGRLQSVSSVKTTRSRIFHLVERRGDTDRL